MPPIPDLMVGQGPRNGTMDLANNFRFQIKINLAGIKVPIKNERNNLSLSRKKKGIMF